MEFLSLSETLKNERCLEENKDSQDRNRHAAARDDDDDEEPRRLTGRNIVRRISEILQTLFDT